MDTHKFCPCLGFSPPDILDSIRKSCPDVKSIEVYIKKNAEVKDDTNRNALIGVVIKLINKHHSLTLEDLYSSEVNQLIDHCMDFLRNYQSSRHYDEVLTWYITLNYYLNTHYLDLYSKMIIQHLIDLEYISHFGKIKCNGMKFSFYLMESCTYIGNNTLNIDEIVLQMKKGRLPGDLSRVEDTDIYISNFPTASIILSFRKDLPIDILVNVSNENHKNKDQLEWEKEYIDYHFLPLDDIDYQDIIATAEKFYQLVEKSKDQNILIHCHAGISRSVSCVVYYLMKKKNMTFDKALNHISETRPIASPNDGFEKQLKSWYDSNCVPN